MKKTLINIIVMFLLCCSDNSQPIISILYPVDGDTLSGNIEVIVEIDTYLDVIKVEYYIDEILAITLSKEPFNWNWNTEEMADSTYALKAYAYTSNGSVGISDIIDVTIDQTLIE